VIRGYRRPFLEEGHEITFFEVEINIRLKKGAVRMRIYFAEYFNVIGVLKDLNKEEI
jgi:hypothetical protein